MKKKLLIFFIILIVIFLILFLLNNVDINNEVNNTINKMDKDDYMITLTLSNNYILNNKDSNTKIIYTEKHKNNTAKINEKIYENNTLLKTNTDNKSFNINLKKFFSKIKSLNKKYKKDNKTYYNAKISSEDAFSLIYKNSKNDYLNKNTNVEIVIFNNTVEKISFKVKNKKTKEEYNIKLLIDFSLQ